MKAFNAFKFRLLQEQSSPEIPASLLFLTLMLHASPYYCNPNQIQQNDPGTAHL